jgi:hypothetical protein
LKVLASAQWLAHDLVPDWAVDPDFVVFGALERSCDDSMPPNERCN